MFHVLMSVEVRHLKKWLRFILKMPDCSPLHLMCAIACAHTSTHATGMISVKNSTHHFCL